MDKDEQNTYMTVTSVDDYSKTKISQSNDDLFQTRGSSATSIDSKNDKDLEKNTTVQNTGPKGFEFKSRGDKIRFGILMVGTLFSMFMMSLNSTVVAPAVTIIATDLNAVSSQTWIATAYLVAVNAFQPLSGKFADIFGRKIVYLFGIAMFFIGSLINALAKNINMLIAGRVIQGFGGGGIMSLVYIIITDITPFHLRPRFQSVLTVIYGIASVIGPLLGGAFVDHASWHWDFWFNIILGGLSFIITVFFLKETSVQTESSLMQKIKRIDFLGSVFSIAFIVCLLLALNWGGTYGWGNAHAFGPFIGAGVSLVALIISEGWIAKEPLLPATVLLNPACLIVYVFVATLGLTFTGTLYFGPIYFQSVFGASSTESGIRLIPFMVCLIGGSIGCGLLIRKFTNIKYYLVFGAASNLLGYGLFYTVNEHSTWGQQAGYLAFCGLAFACCQQNAILSVQKSVDPQYMAIATSCSNFVMLLASSVGIAIYQLLFEIFLKSQLAKLTPQQLAVAAQYGALENFLYIRDMPVEAQAPLVHAYSEALHTVFIMPIAVAGLGFILACLTKNVHYVISEPSTHKSDDSIIVDDEKL